jgi:hypothetical protein
MYITLVERPARRECTTEVAVTEFRPSYRRAAVMQASLAALGFVCSITAWLVEHHWGWLLGGILLVAVIPLLFCRATDQHAVDCLTEVRHTQGSFSYCGTTACGA